MSTPPPADRRYTESHEWHKVDGDTVTIGLTQFAVDALTDVTYVQMKGAGAAIRAGDVVGEVESVKTTSDIYSGVSGEIIEVNSALEADPSLLNSDPFGKGWLIKVRARDLSELNNLMDAGKYAASL